MLNENKLNEFIDQAIKSGWEVIKRQKSAPELPKELFERYGDFPKDYKEFISSVAACTNPTDMAWFLCSEEYTSPTQGGWRWNEFEIMSLEAAEDDYDLKEVITAFWNRHLPIVICMGSGEYGYYAIDLDNGNIVNGCEPEFEETSVTAKSFEEFLHKIIIGKIQLQ